MIPHRGQNTVTRPRRRSRLMNSASSLELRCPDFLLTLLTGAVCRPVLSIAPHVRGAFLGEQR